MPAILIMTSLALRPALQTYVTYGHLITFNIYFPSAVCHHHELSSSRITQWADIITTTVKGEQAVKISCRISITVSDRSVMSVELNSKVKWTESKINERCQTFTVLLPNVISSESRRTPVRLGRSPAHSPTTLAFYTHIQHTAQFTAARTSSPLPWSVGNTTLCFQCAGIHPRLRYHCIIC